MPINNIDYIAADIYRGNEIASQCPRMVLKEITPWAVRYDRVGS